MVSIFLKAERDRESCQTVYCTFTKSIIGFHFFLEKTVYAPLWGWYSFHPYNPPAYNQYHQNCVAHVHSLTRCTRPNSSSAKTSEHHQASSHCSSYHEEWHSQTAARAISAFWITHSCKFQTVWLPILIIIITIIFIIIIIIIIIIFNWKAVSQKDLLSV